MLRHGARGEDFVSGHDRGTQGHPWVACRKWLKINVGFAGCGKTRSGAQEASGHDFSRAVSLAESIRASAPAVCFSGISAEFGPFSAAWTGGAEATGNWVHGVATAIACGLFLCDEVQFSFGMAPNWRYKL